MVQPIATPVGVSGEKRSKPNVQAWYRPTVSHEHGVYVMLLVSFLTGAAAAQSWTGDTALALLSAFCGFQAEHPLVLQIKQRKSWKPRFLVWAAVYGGIAVAIALFLYWYQNNSLSPLLWIYGGAIGATLIDAISVFNREQKSALNELITFAAVCLSAPFAYVVTTGTLAPIAIALWLLNTLFFSSAIFTVNFRKDKAHPVLPGVLYHAVAAALMAIGCYLGGFSLFTASAFGVALLKFAIILWQKEWYCTTKIQFVALLETGSALLFLIMAALSVLPAHLPV